jgi:hypothetical protein
MKRKKSNLIKTSTENFSKGCYFKCTAVSPILYVIEYKHHSLEILITFEPTTVNGPCLSARSTHHIEFKTTICITKSSISNFYSWPEPPMRTTRVHDGCICVLSTLVSEKTRMSITVLWKLMCRQQLTTKIWKSENFGVIYTLYGKGDQ